MWSFVKEVNNICLCNWILAIYFIQDEVLFLTRYHAYIIAYLKKDTNFTTKLI